MKYLVTMKNNFSPVQIGMKGKLNLQHRVTLARMRWESLLQYDGDAVTPCAYFYFYGAICRYNWLAITHNLFHEITWIS